jgi:hypothetical protein
MSENKQEKKEEKQNLKNQEIISNEYYEECKNHNYKINDFYTLYKYLKDEELKIQFKGLVGMRKLCQEEYKKETSKTFFNVLINNFMNFIKDYPEEFQNESLISMINIEKINYKVNNKIKITKDCELIDIVLSKIKNIKNSNIKLSTFNNYLKYIQIIIKDINILEYMIKKKLIDDIITIIKDYINEPDIIITCIKISTNLFKKNANFNLDSKLLSFDEKDIKKPEDIIRIEVDLMDKYPENTKLIKNILKSMHEFILVDKPERLNLLIDLNILQRIIQLVDSKDGNIILFSLRIIGDYAMNNDSFYTQQLINLNALDQLKKTLRKDFDINIRKESSFTLSNIAAGTQEQVKKLYEEDFYPIFYDIIKNEEESPIKTNCLWALYNFSSIKNQDYLEKLVENGYMKIIVDRFDIDHEEILACSLEALDNFLNLGKKLRNPAINNFIENEINSLEIFNAIKKLKKTNEEDLCQKKVNYILTNYFGVLDSNNL